MVQVCVIGWAALQTEDEEQSSIITLLPFVHSFLHVTLSMWVQKISGSLTAVCSCAN